MDSLANWRTRTFSYDSLTRLLTASNPESGLISYGYDADGNVITKTSPLPNQTNQATTVTVAYGYDQLHRLGSKTYSNGDPSVGYSYDAGTDGVGRRTAMTDASGSATWTYNVPGRTVSEQRTIAGVAKTITYVSNPDGSLASLTYPSGRTVTYSTAAAGRALSAIDSPNSINYATAATYAPQGALAVLKNGVTGNFTGIVTTNTYNNRLQPITLSAASPGQTVLSLSYDFHLGSGDNGNVFQVLNNRDAGRSVSYTYDQLNRIQSAASAATAGPNCWGQVFGHMDGSTYVSGYDPWANLKEITVSQCSAPMLSLGVDGGNHVTNTGFAYDAAGNTLADGANQYVYDAENRIKTANGINYTYDGDGRRVKKDTGTLYWTGTGSDPLAESDLSGNLTEEYVFFNGKRIARTDVTNNQITAVHYYFSDHLGSASVVTDAQGSGSCWDGFSYVEEESDFYPFGGERTICSGVNRYKFTGKERDAETGLDDFGARYYSSWLGRFAQPDWSQEPQPVPYATFDEPQTLNLYAYVQNNPLRFVDPTGHDCKTTLLGTTCDFTGMGKAEIEAERLHEAVHQGQILSAVFFVMPLWKLEQDAFRSEIGVLQSRLDELSAKEKAAALSGEEVAEKARLVERIQTDRAMQDDQVAKDYFLHNNPGLASAAKAANAGYSKVDSALAALDAKARALIERIERERKQRQEEKKKKKKNPDAPATEPK